MYLAKTRMDDFVFRNQGYSQIARSVLANLYLKLPKSAYNHIYQGILRDFPIRPYRISVGQAAMGDEVSIDITRDYTDVGSSTSSLLDFICIELVSQMERVPFAAGGPAAMLRTIRSEAMATIDVLEAQIVELRRATVAKYIDAVADVPEADVRAILTALETQVDAPLLGEAHSTEPDVALPKVLRDFAESYAALKHRLYEAKQQYNGAEIIAIDERSAQVAAIVVDYRPPINSADIDVSTEARAARHVLEHVVLAQDAHASELRSDVSHVVVQLEEGIDAAVTVVLQEIREMRAFMQAQAAAQAAEVAQLRAEVAKLNSRPLVVPLKESATAKECRLAGYNAKALLGAGFSPEELAAGGFSAADLKDETYSAPALLKAGMSLRQIGILCCFKTPDDVKAAGMPIVHTFMNWPVAGSMASYGLNWTLQQWCSTGGQDGTPFSSKEVLEGIMTNGYPGLGEEAHQAHTKYCSAECRGATADQFNAKGVSHAFVSKTLPEVFGANWATKTWTL
jgi:hypothetical protein